MAAFHLCQLHADSLTRLNRTCKKIRAIVNMISSAFDFPAMGVKLSAVRDLREDSHTEQEELVDSSGSSPFNVY